MVGRHRRRLGVRPSAGAFCALLVFTVLFVTVQPAQAEAPPAAVDSPAAKEAPPPIIHPVAEVSGRTAGDPAQPAVPRDRSVTGLVGHADPIVQATLGVLLAASVVTWAGLLVKALELGLRRAQMARAIRVLRRAESLATACAALPESETRRLAEAVVAEAEASAGLPPEGIKERVRLILARQEAQLIRGPANGTGILATIAATGPFVGLFGTVWGVMNSFIGISVANRTSLAVVAPGIAEALLATGAGLVAAIPAAVVHNWLVRAVASYRALVADAHALILCHLSRDLDRRRLLGFDRSPLRLSGAAE